METLLVVGKSIIWVVYLGMTFLTEKIFMECKTKGKLAILLGQIILMSTMVAPYWFIESWNNQLSGQLVAIIGLWLMIWVTCFFHRKKIVSIIKDKAVDGEQKYNGECP
ncbi:MAG: hypothetical protein FD167_1061 [bacterium]|nr:MAG: hypothetical protein FD167_1061 [bacterium]